MHFFHGELDEEIYIQQPPWFVAWGESGLVSKLRRSFYRLKQSPHLIHHEKMHFYYPIDVGANDQ